MDRPARQFINLERAILRRVKEDGQTNRLVVRDLDLFPHRQLPVDIQRAVGTKPILAPEVRLLGERRKLALSVAFVADTFPNEPVSSLRDAQHALIE
jgi:hypothetical protein